MARIVALVLAAALMPGAGIWSFAHAGDLASSVDPASLSKKKATSLGLYLSPQDSYNAITDDPGIVYIDVRDPIEIAFVGRAEGLDAIVPVRIVSHEFDPRSGGLASASNKNFVAQVDAIMAREGKGRNDPVILACRSGSRSAHGVELLAAAGYTKVYNQVEGFEGDWNRETGSRDKNGWRNAGLPWTMDLDERVAWKP